MAITTKLELRQSQQLVMTPQLQQAIKLLQLSNLELNEFVDAELERNPLLERDEEYDGPASPAESTYDKDSGSDGDDGDFGDGDTFGDGDGSASDRLDLIGDTTAPTQDLDVDRDVAFAEESPQDIAALLAGSAWSGARQPGLLGGGERALGVEEGEAVEVAALDRVEGGLQLLLR